MAITFDFSGQAALVTGGSFKHNAVPGTTASGALDAVAEMKVSQKLVATLRPATKAEPAVPPGRRTHWRSGVRVIQEVIGVR